MSSRFHASAGMDSHLIPYHKARGDDLLQDKVFAHETVKKGLDILANDFGAGNLAYTPEMSERFQTVLQRRYATNDGWDQFQMPNYAPYVDEDLAAFYGCDTSMKENIMARKETFDEITERLIHDTAREISNELPGLSQMMGHYNNEVWARYGVTDEKPYVHEDPDVTLFRNPDHGWSTIDRPASTSDRSNVVDMYGAVPDYTFATPHEGWLVDRRGRFWDQQQKKNPNPLGFY
jgi:hypothetical protein